MGEEGEMGERKYPPVLKVHFSPDDMERDDSVFRIKTGGEAAASGDGSAESMFERAPSLWMEQEMAGGGGGEATAKYHYFDSVVGVTTHHSFDFAFEAYRQLQHWPCAGVDVEMRS